MAGRRCYAAPGRREEPRDDHRSTGMTARRAVVAVCAAQACAQLGAFAVAALIPTLIPAWGLSNTEAGWIGGIYYAAYTLAVPVLASLTDRVDARRIYLGSVALTAVAFAGFAWAADGFWSALAFRALMGAGWAGSYMPGLKALSDLTEGPGQSRAVAAHAAAVGVSGALSFGVAGAVEAWLGWRWALVPGALGAAVAFVIVLAGVPARPPRPAAGPPGALLDFRPVLRNRSAMAYSLAYCVHTWEMSALRAWVVAFLAFCAAQGGGGWTPLAPATVASVMGLLGVWASVWGNELSIRLGRRRFVLGTMLASAGMAAVVGFGAALPYAGAVALVLVYAMLIWWDSSSLTAGSAGSAEPGRRGATLAVHSTLGYAGGFVGPLALGATLDLAGAPSALGWGLAFGHVTLALGAGAAAFVWLRPADLAGDRPAATASDRTGPSRG
jgi:predicted MFS family arabinose efflux permease